MTVANQMQMHPHMGAWSFFLVLRNTAGLNGASQDANEDKKNTSVIKGRIQSEDKNDRSGKTLTIVLTISIITVDEFYSSAKSCLKCNGALNWEAT